MSAERICQDGWSIETYVIHNEAMRLADKTLQAEQFRHLSEKADLNDRRYGEVNVEKEKALKIKETADLAALELARESQKYKEERNDAMREQTITDKGQYATHEDVAMVMERMEKALKPLTDFVAKQQGASTGSGNTKAGLVTAITVIALVVTAILLAVQNTLM